MKRCFKLIVLVFIAILLLPSCGKKKSPYPEITLAVQSQDIPKIKELIAGGSDVNDKGELGLDAPIHSVKGNNEILKLLIDANADVNTNGANFGNSLIADSALTTNR